MGGRGWEILWSKEGGGRGRVGAESGMGGDRDDTERIRNLNRSV